MLFASSTCLSVALFTVVDLGEETPHCPEGIHGPSGKTLSERRQDGCCVASARLQTCGGGQVRGCRTETVEQETLELES